MSAKGALRTEIDIVSSQPLSLPERTDMVCFDSHKGRQK